MINGVSLSLLQGGIMVDHVRAEPANVWPVIGGYEWPHMTWAPRKPRV